MSVKKLLYATLLTLTISAHAAPTRTIDATTTEGFFSVENLVKNAGFETGSASPKSWTASGGTLAITTTASQVARGNQAASWNSSAAAQTLTGDLASIPSGLKGRNGLLSCSALCASGTCTHQLILWDGTNEVAAQTITSSAATHQRTAVNFIFPTSGSVAVRLKSVAADEPILYVDDCVIGPADGVNLAQVSQATHVGSLIYEGVANCLWATNSAAYGDFAADTDCNTATVTGAITAPATKVPHAKASAAAPGVYVVHAAGTFTADSNNNAWGCRIVDASGTQLVSWGSLGALTDGGGSNVQFPTSLHGQVTYTVAGDREFKLQCKTAAGNAYIFANAADKNLTINVTRYPLTSEIVHRPDLSNKYAATVWTGASGLLCAPTSGSFAACNDSGFDAARTNYGAATNQSTADDLALKIPQMPAGDYDAVFYGQMYPTNAGTDTLCSYAISDGTTTKGTASTASINGVSGADRVSTVGGFFSYSGVADRTFTLMAKRQVGNGDCRIDLNGAALDAVLIITPKRENKPAVNYVGSVTSQSTGAERIERASISAAGAITSQSGAWVTSVTDNAGSGDWTLVIPAGIFSGRPTCTSTIEALNASYNAGQTKVSTDTGPSSTAVRITTAATTGTLVDVAFNVLCMGPR